MADENKASISILVDKDLHKDLKIWALQNDKRIKHIIADIVERGVKELLQEGE